MTDNVLVIPTTHRVGGELPANLPLGDGSLKPLAECTRAEVAEAVEELRALARASRARLEQAHETHLYDVRLLAQLSAYLAHYEEWADVRRGGEIKPFLWHLDSA